MRVNGHRDESGAVAVMVAILLVVMVGMLALTVDGGLLWTKFRAVRTANDAAALAAAYSCATGEGLAGAEAVATEVATANVADATNVEPNEYPQGCEISGGEVTVHYGGQQEMMFGPAIGISSPKPVLTEATATWGGAGGAANVVPLMLSMQRLSDCDIPYDDAGIPTTIGAECFFWWDNGTAQDQTALTNAEWGLIDLRTWDTEPWAACPGNASQGEVSDWIYDGFPGSLLVDPISPPGPPTYVCRGAGFQGGALNNDINAQAGDLLFFPVNDSSQQVRSDGTLCRPNGLDGACSVHKYAIVGFAVLTVVQVWTGQQAQLKCNHPADNNGSLRCLEAVWMGFQPGGILGSGGGQNFGLFAVALTG
jgi:hypothetical protein